MKHEHYSTCRRTTLKQKHSCSTSLGVLSMRLFGAGSLLSLLSTPCWRLIVDMVVHKSIRNVRRDFLHKLSRHLVNNYDHISFEDLDIRGLVQSSNLAKLILDGGWGTLITFVTYKTVMAGARVVSVDPSYTTQYCSVCCFRVPKTLAERLHECPECRAVMDRDYNAGVNILQRGLTRLKGGRIGATRTYACGEGKPSLKQESPCGSSGWGRPLPEAPSVRAERFTPSSFKTSSHKPLTSTPWSMSSSIRCFAVPARM